MLQTVEMTQEKHEMLISLRREDEVSESHQKPNSDADSKYQQAHQIGELISIRTIISYMGFCFLSSGPFFFNVFTPVLPMMFYVTLLNCIIQKDLLFNMSWAE